MYLDLTFYRINLYNFSNRFIKGIPKLTQDLNLLPFCIKLLTILKKKQFDS